MMKLFLIFFFTFSVFSQETKCNNDYNLKGQVQKVIETTSFPKEGTIPKYDVITTYTLNDKDYLRSIEEPDSQGQIQKKVFFMTKTIVSER